MTHREFLNELVTAQSDPKAARIAENMGGIKYFTFSDPPNKAKRAKKRANKIPDHPSKQVPEVLFTILSKCCERTQSFQTLLFFPASNYRFLKPCANTKYVVLQGCRVEVMCYVTCTCESNSHCGFNRISISQVCLDKNRRMAGKRQDVHLAVVWAQGSIHGRCGLSEICQC